MAQAPHGTFGYGSPGEALLHLRRSVIRRGCYLGAPARGPSCLEVYLTSQLKGYRCYLYRAIDREGNLVDTMLSASRDMDAAQRFFRSAQSMASTAPKQVTTDGHDWYPRAIRETLGPKVEHRCNAYLNRRIERNHRAVKQRYYPMLGFGALLSAQRFWRAFEEVRQYFRARRKQNQVISLSKARRQFLFRALELEALFVAA